MTTVADRLKQARVEAGYETATAATEAFGWKYATYAGHENSNRGVPKEALTRYAKAFRVSVGWLIEGKGSKKGASIGDEIEHGGDRFVPLPAYDIRAAAGAGGLMSDGEPLFYQMFREQRLQRLTRAPVEKLALIEVSGDSMAGTLDSGDLILVDTTQTRFGGDGIYVLLVEDALLVKRLSLEPDTGALVLQSDNARYVVQRVTKRERVKIIGRVVWVGRELI